MQGRAKVSPRGNIALSSAAQGEAVEEDTSPAAETVQLRIAGL